jgi:hypothetical protein
VLVATSTFISICHPGWFSCSNLDKAFVQTLHYAVTRLNHRPSMLARERLGISSTEILITCSSLLIFHLHHLVFRSQHHAYSLALATNGSIMRLKILSMSHISKSRHQGWSMSDALFAQHWHLRCSSINTQPATLIEGPAFRGLLEEGNWRPSLTAICLEGSRQVGHVGKGCPPPAPRLCYACDLWRIGGAGSPSFCAWRRRGGKSQNASSHSGPALVG